MTASVSIDRTSLALSALVISDAGATYLLTDKGLGRPATTRRNTYAPESPDMHGSLLLNSVKEQSALPLEVIVQADTAADLDAAIQALFDALDQFTYNTTVTVDGVAKVWASSPAAYGASDGYVDHSRVAQFFDVLAITIPVYPIPGA